MHILRLESSGASGVRNARCAEDKRNTTDTRVQLSSTWARNLARALVQCVRCAYETRSTALLKAARCRRMASRGATPRSWWLVQPDWRSLPQQHERLAERAAQGLGQHLGARRTHRRRGEVKRHVGIRAQKGDAAAEGRMAGARTRGEPRRMGMGFGRRMGVIRGDEVRCSCRCEVVREMG